MATEAGLGMKTTFGASAFHNASANEDAFIVKKIREAGMIVLGKANLDVSVVAYVFACAYQHQELNGFKLRFAICQVALADLTQRRSSTNRMVDDWGPDRVTIRWRGLIRFAFHEARLMFIVSMWVLRRTCRGSCGRIRASCTGHRDSRIHKLSSFSCSSLCYKTLHGVAFPEWNIAFVDYL